MGLFYSGDESHIQSGVRRTGFSLYRYVLEGSWKELFLVGFITLIFFIPFGAGLTYGIMSQSLLVSIASGIVGGLISAPGYACMEDLILRRMRGDLGDWWACWKLSFRQNVVASLLPGMVQCIFISVFAFGCALFYWGAAQLTPGTLVVFVVSALLVMMLLSAWWPQVVLFDQKAALQVKNAVYFCILHFGKVLSASAVRFLWWAACVLFMPWTGLLVPVLSVWYIMLVTTTLIYTKLDDDFRIEEQISEKYPGRLES